MQSISDSEGTTVGDAVCHPNRKVWVRGICQPCYGKLRFAEREAEVRWDVLGIWGCRTCQQEKPRSEFYLNRDKPRNHCKTCVKKRTVARQKVRYQTDSAYRDYVKMYAAKWEVTNSYRHHLKTRYNLTVQQYDALLANQGGVCSICLKPPTTLRRLVVDHDHISGQIRGLLHNSCNSALGTFEDDPESLERAIRYLKRQPIVRIA